MIEVAQHNTEKNGYFEGLVDGQFAGKMTYTWAGEDKFIIDHTEVEPAYNGKGIGREMVMAAVEFAREKGLKIIPLCPFPKASFQRNREWDDVLA